MIIETLFSKTECPPTLRKFLWWSWYKDGHSWFLQESWKTPLHYGTCFWDRYVCLKCGATKKESYEGYGP